MTKSSSADLREQVTAAGIPYLPADQVFYRDFPYKVELSPKFKGIGGVSGKRGCQIDVSDTVKGRQKLAEFNELMNKIFSNVEYRKEIREYVERLPKAEYKTRMGGENNLFYFRDPHLVIALVEKYHEVINSVTGPLSNQHIGVMEEVNVVMRDRLYFNRFRYMIEFERTDNFVQNSANQILDYLKSLDRDTWRDHKLLSIIRFHELHGSVQGKKAIGIRQPIITNGQPYSFPPRSVMIYLTDPNDYVYIKLMAGEYIKKNHEVVLFGELK
jgi:hypothetical protein